MTLSTLLGSAFVPLAEWEHAPNSIGVEVDWEVAQAGHLYLFVMSTHPGVIEEEDITDAVNVAISKSDEARMYRPSDLRGLAAARIGTPAAAAVSSIEWEATSGAYGFSMPTLQPTVAYSRSGAAGDHMCMPDNSPATDMIGCLDDFWGPPGRYVMFYGATVSDADWYMAGWVDMPIP